MEEKDLMGTTIQPSLELGEIEAPVVKLNEGMTKEKLETPVAVQEELAEVIEEVVTEDPQTEPTEEKQVKETKPKKETKAKEEPKKLERYKGTIIYCNGLQQSPMNLDAIFSKDEMYQKYGGTTKEGIKQVASKAIVELQNPGVDIEIINDPKLGNCFFLKNNMSKKGTVEYDCIPFEDVENHFKKIYEEDKTEARVLIYYNLISNKFIVDYPEYIEKSAVTTTNNVSYCLDNDVNKYLICDLHSHHKMGKTFSPTDDADEKGKARIIFGVYSFSGGWNFRYWHNNLEKFTYLDTHDKPETILRWLKVI